MGILQTPSSSQIAPATQTFPVTVQSQKPIGKMAVGVTQRLGSTLQMLRFRQKVVPTSAQLSPCATPVGQNRPRRYMCPPRNWQQHLAYAITNPRALTKCRRNPASHTNARTNLAYLVYSAFAGHTGGSRIAAPTSTRRHFADSASAHRPPMQTFPATVQSPPPPGKVLVDDTSQRLRSRQKAVAASAQLPPKDTPFLQISPVTHSPDKQLVERPRQPEPPKGALLNPPLHCPGARRYVLVGGHAIPIPTPNSPVVHCYQLRSIPLDQASITVRRRTLGPSVSAFMLREKFAADQSR
jgi:hypothetical protein